MRNHCTIKGCSAPFSLCLKNPAQAWQDCAEFKAFEEEKAPGPGVSGPASFRSSGVVLPWQGGVFQPGDIQIVSSRTPPRMIGMIGTKDAGKTSYLGMLYTLLFRGMKFHNWQFAGSQTLAGWELPAKYLKIRPDGTTHFPPPTSSNPAFYSLYHLGIRDANGNLSDVIYADSSGEVFTKWSINPDDPEAQNAAWIYNHADGFILFVDCVALIEKRGEVKQEIVQIAEQIACDLVQRPVTIVWSKSDRIQEIRPNIREALSEDLLDLIPNAKVVHITNFPKQDSDPMCHVNNLAVSEYLFDSFTEPCGSLFPPLKVVGDDFFYISSALP